MRSGETAGFVDIRVFEFADQRCSSPGLLLSRFFRWRTGPNKDERQN
jgi:hypothetical protein